MTLDNMQLLIAQLVALAEAANDIGSEMAQDAACTLDPADRAKDYAWADAYGRLRDALTAARCAAADIRDYEDTAAAEELAMLQAELDEHNAGRFLSQPE